MNFLSKQKYIKLYLLGFLVVISFSGFSQGFVIDTTGFFQEVDTAISVGPSLFDYDFTNESDLDDDDNKTGFAPGDVIFIPSDVLNNSKWDTLYIRTSRVDLSKMDEPKVIVLDNPEEGRFCFPFRGKLLSPYGPRGRSFHAGMDIKLETGDTVQATFSGKVRIARVMSGYGKMVVIRHNNGLETVYGHLSKILVDVNQDVKAGEPIGLGGRTGRATTSHLHFETRYLGEHFNPEKIIDFNNFCVQKDTVVIDKDFFSKKTKIASSGSASDNNSGEVTKKYHTIKSGDTLYAISLKYKTTVNKICKLNGITPKKKLTIGNRIRVK
ncbi:MAG: hypothetical protein CVU14_00180 [Bacteroidetes bacterium HGW-Bacteroidetes-9]|jgi:murein DD-endopeptidase MepM/ murein hydrolase activator NlpD|nr:MAG: hypothetical protein CVU14_00180 [Bacteroidetes bacterium HGW-Bacteroidetes-9]